MRVVLFVGTLNLGGAQRQFVQLADALARRGHAVTVAASKPGGLYWDWLVERDGGAKLFPLFSGPGPKSALLTPFRWVITIWRLHRILRRERSHVLYSALDLSNVLAWLAAWGSGGTQVVWGIRASKQKLNWKRKVPYELSRLLSSRVPLIIANSHAGVAAIRSDGFRPRATAVVANGIDTAFFVRDEAAGRALRREWGIGDGVKAIGLPGRLAPVKGYDVFLRAAAILISERRDLRFVCIGSGREDHYARELRRLADQLGLKDYVRWVGECRDMRAAYSALDVACCPSRSEAFSNVVAEAMACEAPCVASDVGDTAHIIGSTGVLVPPEDAPALARGIARLLDEPTAAALAAEGRRRIVDLFGIDNLARRTEQELALVVTAAEATAWQPVEPGPG